MLILCAFFLRVKINYDGLKKYRDESDFEQTLIDVKHEKIVAKDEHQVKIDFLSPKTIYTFNISAEYGDVIGPVNTLKVETGVDGKQIVGAFDRTSGLLQAFISLTMLHFFLFCWFCECQIVCFCMFTAPPDLHAPQLQNKLSDTSVLVNLYQASEQHGPVIHYYVIVVPEEPASSIRPDEFNLDEVSIGVVAIQRTCEVQKHVVVFLCKHHPVCIDRFYPTMRR